MIPVKLDMENFFSHKNSSIDFAKFDSCLLIGNTEGDYSKSNGSGKSAIFESILWCLFNKSRAAMMDDIIRWGETTCSVSLEFSHDDKTYKVRRSRNRMNSSSSVEFYMLDSFGEWQDISGSTSGDTNRSIEDSIKLNHKTFINSVYFRQNDISEFAESDASRKKEVLKSIVDISRWDEYDKAARKKARDLKIECKVLQASISEYDSLVSDLDTFRSEIKISKENVKSLMSERDSVGEQLQLLRKEYTTLKKSLDTDSYDRAVESISELKKQLVSLGDKKNKSEDTLSKYTGERDKLKKSISDLESQIRDKVIVEVRQDDLDELRDRIVEERSKISAAKSILEDLSNVKISEDACHHCGQEIDKPLYERLKASHDDNIVRYTQQLSDSKASLQRVSADLEEKLAYQRFNKVIVDSNKKIDGFKYKLDLVLDSLSRAESEDSELNNKIRNAKLGLETNNNIIQSIKNEDFQNLRVKIQALKLKRETVLSSISKEDKDIGRLEERISILEKKKEGMESSKERLDESLKKIAMFEKLAKFLGKGGIQTILLDTVIEDLENTSNKILSSICNEPAVIVLETQRMGSDGITVVETLDLKVRKDGSLQNFKSLSGGEKFRISLALRIALSDLSSRYGGSSLEFLLLDEVNSPLDRFGVETLFVNVIKSLEDKYKIMVITHDESLKEKFDNVIDVTKVNGDSEIEFAIK